MRRPQRWLLSRWSGRQSLFAPTTIAEAATRQEAIRGIAIPTTTERPTTVYVAIEARCPAPADGNFYKSAADQKHHQAKGTLK
jgi:hypothetical protein